MLDRSCYQPSPWGQRFHDLTADEALGGGAAGCAKSMTLLFDPIVKQALVEHARAFGGEQLNSFPPELKALCERHPIRPGESEGHALHLRRSMPQLLENIDRAGRMFPKFDPGAVYSKERHSWTFSSGYKFTFGHCREKDSHQDYLSKQYTHLALDEAYQFEEYQYEELDARVRTADPVLKFFLATRAMSNPAPGWLKDRFVVHEPKGNVLFRVKVPDPQTGELHYRTRYFMPGRLDDNPDKEFVRQYKIRLLSKPSHMRARYLYGDWDSVEGGYFEDDYNPQVHIIEPFKIPRDWPKFRSMDWGYKAPGVIGWYALDRDENLYKFFEFNFRLMKDEEVAFRLKEIEERFGFWNKRENKSRLQGVADTQLWEERGDSGKPKAAVFAEKGIYWRPADKASIARNAERITERLRDYDKDKPPGLMLFNNCKKTAGMLASIAVDEKDSTVPDKGSPLKHWFDETAYGCAYASRGRAAIPFELHDFDRAENDNDEPAPAATGSYGYGT